VNSVKPLKLQESLKSDLPH